MTKAKSISRELFNFICFGAILPLFFSCTHAGDQKAETNIPEITRSRVVTGAEVLIAEKLEQIKGKRIAIVANHTSLVQGTHLVDTLFSLGLDIRKIFAPEHGFRGDHDAGKKVDNSRDEKTGLPLVSLYGSNKKPSAAQLADIDVILFDIQDVGARFYTYISTMSYVMEAAAENNKQVFILDRPTPNGWYVDGPILEKELSSFVGMHPVPIVHGMSIGEYAKMVNGEKWLEGSKSCILTVIPCKGYRHEMRWEETGLDWVPPSPNLATPLAAYLYPMLCWYEGMPVSVGRGTENPFTLIGAPWHAGYSSAYKRDSILKSEAPALITLYGLQMESIKFTPRSIPGKATHPKFEDQVCYGVRFINQVEGKELFLAGLSLLLNFQEEKLNTKLSKTLFEPFFDKLSGSQKLKFQIEKKLSPEEIYSEWEQSRAAFNLVRSKYLLYP